MRFPFRLRADAEYDAVGFGTNAVDHLIRVPSFPPFGSKIEFLEHSTAVGGEIASTLVGLSRLGARTAYAGRFGRDAEGELGLASIVEEGVNTEYAEIIAGARTQVAFILVDEATGERTIIWRRDQKLAYSHDDAPIGAATKGRVLHMTAHDTDACISMAKAARKVGSVVSLDVDNVFEGITDLLPLVDVCIVSTEFPQQLTAISDHEAALGEISVRFGCSVTGMTVGRAGSIIVCGGEVIKTPGFDVPGGCTDTTGAGDAFRSGFLHGLLKGRDIEESAVIANAVAALKCRRNGARAGLPSIKELSDFLKSAPT